MPARQHPPGRIGSSSVRANIPPVRTRRIGNQTVTAVGGGDLCLATSAARGIAASDVARALHEAIELGISLIDVAAETDGERLAGDCVRTLRARDRVVVATRVPLLDRRPGAPNRDGVRERLPAAYLTKRVEDSLRATRLDVLPLAQLALRPAWIASPAWPELVGTCARLVREGKVLAWGALLDEPTDDAAPALLAEPWLVAVSVVYHLWARTAEPLFEAAAKRELAVLARQPLAGGALAGSLGPGSILRPRDDRHALDAAALERIALAIARLAPLVKREPPAARSTPAARRIIDSIQPAAPGPSAQPRRPEHLECMDVAELALRFAIDRAGVALPRLHRREHVIAAIAAASAPPLSPALVARIVEETG
jgi:aryl-alcohol dehydrogenase-like predicted oxidoreductase